MFELTTFLPDLVPSAYWRLALPALALPAAVALPLATRRGGAQWLRWRLQMLPRDRYQVLERPPLPVAKDGDHVEYVVLSRHGVFLVQMVDRGGRIAGKADDKVWAQKSHKGSVAFHNPLRLGRRRAAVLAAAMDIDPDVLFPVVAFTGQCRFDNPMPDNVTGPFGCLSHVQSPTGIELDDEELERIRDSVEAGLHDPRWQARLQPPPAGARPAAGQVAGPVCPRCGAALGAYSYKTGARAGQMFSGCTGFPACGYRAYPVRKPGEKAPASPSTSHPPAVSAASSCST